MQSIKTASAAAVGGLAGGGAILLAGPELFVGGATLGVLGAAAAGGSLEAPLAQPAGLCTTPSPARMRNFNNTNMRGTVQFVTNSSLRLPSEPQKRACACSRVRLETKVKRICDELFASREQIRQSDNTIQERNVEIQALKGEITRLTQEKSAWSRRLLGKTTRSRSWRTS
jgi:hypothetical protein